MKYGIIKVKRAFLYEEMGLMWWMRCFWMELLMWEDEGSGLRFGRIMGIGGGWRGI